MPWTFSNKTGRLLDPDGDFIETGYSGGNCGKNPEGVDNPADEYIKDVGPIPEGWYTFGTPVEGTHLGPCAIPLTPDADDILAGRGGFFMHGDLIGAAPHSGSEGCIIMSRTTRELVAASNDKRLQVIIT